MKKLIIIIVLGFFPLGLPAQPQDVQSLFEKYKDRPGFTKVDITDPSVMLGDMSDKEDNGAMKDMMQGMKGIKVLTIEEAEGKNAAVAKEFNEDLKRITTTKDYKEFLSVSEEGSYVKMYVRKSGDDVSEFLLIAIEDNESTLLWVNGKLNMKQLGKMGKMLNLEGLDKLQKDKGGEKGK